MYDCLLQGGVSRSFSGLTISDEPTEDCTLNLVLGMITMTNRLIFSFFFLQV